VCEANKDKAVVIAKPDGSNTCVDVCKKHNMVCMAAAASSVAEEEAEGAEGAEGAGRRLGDQHIHCNSDLGDDEASCATAVGNRLKCSCGADPEPFRTQSWTGDKLCPTCYASTEHDGTIVGAMTTEFKIKKNALSFYLKGAPGATRFVSLTVKNTKVVASKALKGQPTISEPPSNMDGTWYPVEWDLSQYVGEVAVLEVNDEDPNESISVDNFEFYNDKHGCLPACMKVKDDVCEGETCFYFEDDKIAYRQLQKTGPQSGVYCRSVPMGTEGSPLGPGIQQMGSEGKNGRVSATLDYLAASALPRCVHISLKGSHIGIRTADKALGDDEEALEFAYAPQVERMGAENAMCVYPTLKPRCVAYSKAAAAFKLSKKAICAAKKYEATCFDQCYSIHCSEEELRRKGACGRGKAFQDCANCCGSNNNVASGCFRRRRRLGAAVSAISIQDSLVYTVNECAEACLNTFGCMAFLLGEDNSCTISDECDATKKGSYGFHGGKWMVWRSLKSDDLTSAATVVDGEEGGDEPVRKKRKKKRKGGKGKDSDGASVEAPAESPAAE